MSDLIVDGARPISGTIRPSGNKNAVLPMLCATLLTDEEVTLTNVPEISDIDKLVEDFRSKGSAVSRDLKEQTLTIKHDFTAFAASDAELPVGIRAAVLLLAPVLLRSDFLIFDTEAKGCALGVREIDPHLEILERFGGVIAGTHPYRIERRNEICGADMWPTTPRCTATETFAMIAVLAMAHLASGNNAASEPHVQALCDMLASMGADIDGIGTSKLTVRGVGRLSGTVARVPDDHHEVATFPRHRRGHRRPADGRDRHGAAH